jgi:S-adenosylmethionine-diacylglycerol 3-amino-3-carboxypropyl transferase
MSHSPGLSPLEGRISYAQVWEDEQVLRQALDAGPGLHLLSIASGGDNALALALAGARVTALDLSRPQLALTELKLAAGCLSYPEYLAFLGLTPSRTRLDDYRRVRESLSESSRAFWDAHPEMLEAGVVHQGRLEQFLALFRRFVLPLIHSRDTVEALLCQEGMEAQRRFFRERWDTMRWRTLFRLFFSRPVIALRGRSHAQFRHVDTPVAEQLLGRSAWVLTELPVATNPYLEWMLTGGYRSPATARTYLSPEGHARLDEARERIQLVHADLGTHLARSDERYDGFNYSDLFEYLSAEQHTQLLGMTVAASRPGARLAYWNLFVPRFRPDSLADRLERREEEARRLHATDRAFLYGAFQLEVVR